MTIKAIIFDFDGIITDTEPIHFDAWLAVLEPMGITFDDDIYHREYIGLTDNDFLNAVAKNSKIYWDANQKKQLIDDKTQYCLSSLSQKVPLLPGVEEFVKHVNQHYPLAICSGANRSEIEFILHQLKWPSIFNPIIASDSVGKGKPDPEGYIRAFENISQRIEENILPGQVMAIEDSPKGIAAAKAAGLFCVGVSNSYDALYLKQADIVVDTILNIDT